MSTALLERPAPELELRMPAPAHAPAAPRPRGASWTTVLPVVMAAAAIWWAIGNASTLRHGVATLPELQLGWLSVAVVAAVATWGCSALSQQGAYSARLPMPRLMAAQFAGTFANQFTPAGLGGGAVNVRFLRRRGSSHSAAIASVGLTQIAGVAVHFLLLALVIAADPSLLETVPVDASQAPSWSVPAVLLVLLVAAGIAIRHPARLRALLLQVQESVAHLRRPTRTAQLVLGSAGLTLAHILVLYGILRALAVHPTFLAVAAAYLLATTAAALLPTPGGLGSLDACLGMLLYGSGVTSATAVAAVLAYRLLTSWLALAPSALTLNVLVRRGVV